jgi:hypothetical protein
MVTDEPLAPKAGDTLLTTGVGVKLTVPLLGCPATLTTTLPAVAWLGTAATMLVLLQLLGVAATPLNVILLAPVAWLFPNPVPFTVTRVPLTAVVGEILVITGVTVKLKPALA